MEQDERRVSINISAVPVAGVGGLGLVAMAAVVAIFQPAIGPMVAIGLAGGVTLGIALVALRRVRKQHGPSGDDPSILFRDAVSDRPVPQEIRRSGGSEFRKRLLLTS